MQQFWSDKARSISPYTAGEQPHGQTFIKLNTNENAYPPSPRVQEAVEAAQLDGALRLYPPSDSRAFCAAAAARHGLPAEWAFAGNGSDEVLALAYLAFFNPGAPVATPAVGYSFYPVYADLYNMHNLRVPMLPGMCVDVDALIASGAPIVLANPNAPTAIGLPIGDIRRMALALQSRGQPMLLDEAYCDFGCESAASLLSECRNLLIVRTLSKSHALAGMRLGYALGQPDLLQALWRIKDSFNSYPLDRVAQAAGEAALRDDAYFRQTSAAIMSTRAWFVDALPELGFSVLPSQANFVFARHNTLSGAHVQLALRERGVLVRRFPSPDICDYLRITIGTDADMRAVLLALSCICNAY